MSAIAGWVSWAGGPADARLLDRMMSALRGRGHETDAAAGAQAALAQVHLRVGAGPRETMRPVAASDTVWLAVDARVDGRDALARSMRNAGVHAQAEASHAELVAQAFGQWGGGCGLHLQGDFAFAAWDVAARRLTCVRDHFGVRPLYYTANAHRLAFASDMRALLELPDVGRDLDEDAVADYLMFGACMDADRTIYREIRCVPPGSALTVDGTSGLVRVDTYWQPRTPAALRLRDAQAYADGLREVLGAAVADRLPNGIAAYQISGGLDSTAIAATAARLRGPNAPREPAYTISSGDLHPEDREAEYAELAARMLPLDLHRQDLNHYTLFERTDSARLATPYPMFYPLLAAHRDMLDAMLGRGASVLFSGYGADALFTPSSDNYARLLRRGRWLALTREIGHHVRLTGTLRGMGLRHAVRPATMDAAGRPDMPDWLEPAFAARVDARGRWEKWWALYLGALEGHQQLALPWHSRQFEMIELWPMPLVGRYPFMDPRVVRFLLSLPNAMRSRKEVLRRALSGALPQDILERPKTALAADPVRKLVTNGKLIWKDPASVAAQLPWIDASRYRASLRAYSAGRWQEATWGSALMMAPLGLQVWLGQQQDSRSD